MARLGEIGNPGGKAGLEERYKFKSYEDYNPVVYTSSGSLNLQSPLSNSINYCFLYVTCLYVKNSQRQKSEAEDVLGRLERLEEMI